MPSTAVARIAIVDDDRVTLAIMTDALGGGGFEVLPFTSGEEALAALWDAPVDLMVVDLLLPRMSGIDLARELRARPWAGAMPILAVTALRWGGEQIVAIEDAMSPAQLVRKPIHPDDFLSIVQAMLARAVKRELRAAPPEPAPVPRVLVLAGADDLVPRETTGGFYRRSEIRVVRTPSLGAAVAIAERQRGHAALIVNGELLRGESAIAKVAQLLEADVAFAAVIAGPEQASRLPPELPVIDASLPPRCLLETICRRASLAQRSSARVEVRAQVHGVRAGGGLLRGTVEDVSLGGLRMLMDPPCAVGDRLEVELDLPDGGGRVKGAACAVRVSWPRPGTPEVSVGVAFERLDGHSVDALRRFLEARAGAEAYRRYRGITSSAQARA